MSYINIPIKDNSTPLTPTEFNYLVDMLNLRKLRNLIDVQDADPQDKQFIRHNGSGWVYYKITDDHYTKAQINQLLGVEDIGGTPALTVNWGEIKGTIRDQLDLVANFGDLKATQNIWDGKHFAENYILDGSTESVPSAGTMDEFFITDGVDQVAVTDSDILAIKGNTVDFDFANKEFNILDNPVDGYEYIDFKTGLSNPSWKEGRLYWNDAKHSLAFYDDVTDTELNIGEEQRVRVINANASTIFNGEAVSVNGVDPVTGHITVTHAIASDKDSAINTIGIATHDILLGEEGWVAISGFVGDVDSSAYTEGAALYLSDTVAGAFQETRPISPSYEVRMGGVARSHATEGKYFVEPRIIDNDHDNNRFFNGAILEANEVTWSTDGVNVNVALNSLDPSGRLSLIFSQDYVSITSGININLILGTDSAPLENWVYIDNSGTMQTSTSGFPTGVQFTPVCRAIVPSASFAQTYGLYKLHAYTDHLGGSTGQGHLSHINEWIRKRPASWNWGVSLTTSSPENTATPRLDLSYTAGNISQLHDHGFPAVNTALHPAFVANDFNTPYALANGITSAIDTDALGNAITNNKYYRLVVWGVISEDEEDSHIFFNLPNGSYTTISGVEADSDNLTNYAIPIDYLGTGFLIGEFLLQRTTSTVRILPNGIKDLRGSIPTAGGGSTIGGGGITRFDELVDVPSSKIGHAGKLTRVNATEDALEYVDGLTLYSAINHTHDYSSVYAPLVHNHDSDYQAKVSTRWVWINDGADDCYLEGADDNPVVYGNTFGASMRDYGDKVLNSVMFYLGGLDAKHGLSVNGTDVSLSGHTHDYAPTNHNHDGDYSDINHVHDYSSIFAPISHQHDSLYAPISHSHSYLPLSGGTITGNLTVAYQNSIIFTDSTSGAGSAMRGSGEHWQLYEPEDSNKVWLEFKDDDGLYVLGTKVSLTNHNHSSLYAPIVHDHDGVYSLTSHNHSGVYAPASHTHSYAPLVHDHDLDYLGITAKAADSSKLDGLVLGTGRNNSANQVVRTSGSGYLETGWINTTSGSTTNAVSDVYVNTADGYIRKKTLALFKTELGIGIADSITPDMLSSTNSATNGYHLKYDSASGKFAWTTSINTASYASYISEHNITGTYWDNTTSMNDRLMHSNTTPSYISAETDTNAIRVLRFGGSGGTHHGVLAMGLEGDGHASIYSYLVGGLQTTMVKHGDIMLKNSGGTFLYNDDAAITDGWADGYRVQTPAGYTGITTETTITGFGMKINLASGTGGWARTMGKIQWQGADKLGFGAYGSSSSINFMWFGGAAYNSGKSLKIDEYGNVNIGNTGSSSPSTSYKLQVQGVTQLDGKVSNTGGLRLNGGFYDTQVMQRVTINNVAHFSADNNRVQLFRGSLGDYSSVSNTSDPFFDMAMSRDNAVNGTALVVPYFAMTLEGRRNVYLVSTRYAEGGISAINSGLQVGFSENWVPDLTSTRCLAVNGTVGATAFYNDSLRKWKKNIKPFVGNATELINSLDIVTFDYKDEKSPNDVIGVIADDTHPYVLNEEGDAVDLNKVIFVQAKAMQEMDERIEMLEAKLELLIKNM